MRQVQELPDILGVDLNDTLMTRKSFYSFNEHIADAFIEKYQCLDADDGDNDGGAGADSTTNRNTVKSGGEEQKHVGGSSLTIHDKDICNHHPDHGGQNKHESKNNWNNDIRHDHDKSIRESYKNDNNGSGGAATSAFPTLDLKPMGDLTLSPIKSVR